MSPFFRSSFCSTFVLLDTVIGYVMSLILISIVSALYFLFSIFFITFTLFHRKLYINHINSNTTGSPLG